MRCWVISPNVNNDGKSLEWISRSISESKVFVGYGEGKKHGNTFIKTIKNNDIIIIAQGSKDNRSIYFAGIVCSDASNDWPYFRRLKYTITQKELDKSNIMLDSKNARHKSSNPGTIYELKLNNSYDKQVIEKLNEIFKMKELQYQINENIDLLNSNKNLVLTGAPGTGKTYLAKKIAEKIVVNKIKEFFDFDEIDIKEYIKEKEIVKTIENYSFSIISITNNNIKIKPNNAKNEYSVPRKDIIECLKTECYNKSVTESNKSGVGSYMIGIAKRIITRIIERYISFVQFHPSYDYTDFVEGLRPKKEKDSKELGFELKNGIFKEFCKKAKGQPEKDFVFIIDEINRAEISKVFGELFFAIDPGYRGEEGKVKTQYANMQTDETFFTDKDDDYFFVPENVYIIATMNDIDRSVESFDFAMRRRFAWKEIKASENFDMWTGKIDKWKESAGIRMNSLNAEIENTDGLNSSYHIGPVYFLKLVEYKGDFDKLWKNHLEVLLREYLRGMPNAEIALEKLKNAYYNK